MGFIVALIWHPDKVDATRREEAEEVFKSIKEAYEVLSDGLDLFVRGADVLDQKRQLYDQYGRQLNLSLVNV